MQKVLVITYYWPPAGGPGVQRWLNFIKYLPENGYEPLVYVPEKADYPIVDESLKTEIPKVRVLSQPIFEPYRIAGWLSKKKTKRISSGLISESGKQSLIERLLLWVRGNFFIPDARKFWVKPSIAFLGDLIEKEAIEKIITTGPPHSVHLIGLGIKQRHHVEWTADFRDPWTTIGYHKRLKLGKRAQRRHLQLESSVLGQADKLIVTSNHTKRQFEKLTDRPIEVITNGYEGERPTVALDRKFSLSHIGSLLTGRNPETLWIVLKELMSEVPEFKEHLSIQLVGVVSPRVSESLASHGLEEFTTHKGYITHEAVLQVQAASQILLLLEIDSTDTVGILPGKLFEYFNAKRPILAIGPAAWEAAELIESTQSGKFFTHGEKKELKVLLLDWFERYQENRLSVASSNVDAYSRSRLTKALANYLTWESS
ncbi:MAG: glycosyl transferase family 1 [Flavobacteriaceae bacterium]|nr:glycosyl transferase family 1 [Flavobacteriaceae bacterium]